MQMVKRSCGGCVDAMREISGAKFRNRSRRCVHLLFMRHGPHETMQALQRHEA